MLGASLSTTLAFAQSADPIVPAVPLGTTITAQAEGSTTLNTTKLTRIQATGAQLIKQRISSLNSLTTQINASKLGTDQKATLTASIATNISGLTSLGGQIASATDASSTKSLVQSIYTNFRIYAVFIPQIKWEKRINDLQNHIVKLGDTFAKVQANIDAAKAKGKDVSVWQASLTAAKASVATDSTQLTTLWTNVMAIKPADYPTSSKTQFATVSTGVKAVVNDLQGIAKKIHRPTMTNNTGTINASTTISGTVR